MYGKLSPLGSIIIMVIYFSLLIIGAVKILKHERGLSLFLWLAINFLVPFIGPILYIGYHHFRNKESGVVIVEK